MQIERPSFYNSPYLIIDEKGWRLKPGAPKELVKEFNDFMESIKNK